MKNLSLTFCLVIAALFGSVGSGFANQTCQGSPSRDNVTVHWHKCFGVEYWSNGQKYFGDYFNGVKHGKGTSTWSSGSRYVGEWQDDNMNGRGI